MTTASPPPIPGASRTSCCSSCAESNRSGTCARGQQAEVGTASFERLPPGRLSGGRALPPSPAANIPPLLARPLSGPLPFERFSTGTGQAPAGHGQTPATWMTAMTINAPRDRGVPREISPSGMSAVPKPGGKDDPNAIHPVASSVAARADVSSVESHSAITRPPKSGGAMLLVRPGSKEDPNAIHPVTFEATRPWPTNQYIVQQESKLFGSSSLDRVSGSGAVRWDARSQWLPRRISQTTDPLHTAPHSGFFLVGHPMFVTQINPPSDSSLFEPSICFIPVGGHCAPSGGYAVAYGTDLESDSSGVRVSGSLSASLPGSDPGLNRFVPPGIGNLAGDVTVRVAAPNPHTRLLQARRLILSTLSVSQARMDARNAQADGILVFVSNDCGPWSAAIVPLSGDFSIDSLDTPYMHVNPQSPNIVYLCAKKIPDDVFFSKSLDGGESWTTMAPLPRGLPGRGPLGLPRGGGLSNSMPTIYSWIDPAAMIDVVSMVWSSPGANWMSLTGRQLTSVEILMADSADGGLVFDGPYVVDHVSIVKTIGTGLVEGDLNGSQISIVIGTDRECIVAYSYYEPISDSAHIRVLKVGGNGGVRPVKDIAPPPESIGPHDQFMPVLVRNDFDDHDKSVLIAWYGARDSDPNTLSVWAISSNDNGNENTWDANPRRISRSFPLGVGGVGSLLREYIAACLFPPSTLGDATQYLIAWTDLSNYAALGGSSIGVAGGTLS